MNDGSVRLHTRQETFLEKAKGASPTRSSILYPLDPIPLPQKARLPSPGTTVSKAVAGEASAPGQPATPETLRGVSVTRWPVAVWSNGHVITINEISSSDHSR